MNKKWLLIVSATLALLTAGWYFTAPLFENKEVKYVAYVGRFTDLNDASYENLYDQINTIALSHYLEEINDDLEGLELELLEFDCKKSPQLADSIYELIATNKDILFTVDNTWGVDLKGSQQTIKTSNLPVLAINGDRNNLDFGSSVLFTGNGEPLPTYLSSYLKKGLDSDSLIFISEVDYELHNNYMRSIENGDLEMVRYIPFENNDLSSADSLTFFQQIKDSLSNNSYPIVINAHSRMGSKIVNYINDEFKGKTILAHTYIVKMDEVNVTDHGNSLVFMTTPKDALSQAVNEDIEYFQSLDSSLFNKSNVPFVVKRCVDIRNLLSYHLDQQADLTKEGFQTYFNNCIGNEVVVENNIYRFTQDGDLIKDQIFAEYKNGQFNTLTQQLTPDNRVIPNIIFGADIQDIYEVDVNSNSFTADFYYWIKYDSTNSGAERYILFQNMKQSESSKELLYEKKQGSTIYKLYRGSGKFFVDFEMSQFPFDEQELEIQVQMLQPSDYMSISFDLASMEDPQVAMDKFKVTGWDKANYFVTVDNLLTENLRGDQLEGEQRLRKFKNVVFRLKIKRLIWPAVLQIVLPLFMIGSIAIAVMFLRNQKFKNLGEVAAGIFLTIVAFSIALSDMAPSSSVLTKADLLFLLTFLVVCIGFLNLIIKNVMSKTDAELTAFESPILRKSMLITFPILYAIIIFI